MKKILIVCVILILGLTGLGYYKWSSSELVMTARRLPAERAAAKAEHLPLFPIDLARNPPVPPEKNAAEQVRVLCGQAKFSGKDIAALGQFTERNVSWQTQSQAAVAAVENCKRLFELMDDAVSRPECDFQRDYSPGPAVLFPEFADIKAAVKAASAKAWIESNTGNRARAWDTLAKTAKLARFSGCDPTLISLLVRCACESIVLRRTEEMLAQQGGDAQAIAGTRRVVAALGSMPDFRFAFSGESVMGRMAVRMLEKSHDFKALLGSEVPLEFRNPIATTPTAFDAYEVRLIEFYRTVFKALPKTPEDLSKFGEAMARLDQAQGSDRSMSGALNRILFPVFAQIGDAVAKVIVRRRLSLTAATIYEDRNRTGKFPSKLPDLGATRIDLFSGDPFRYGTSEPPFVLYSVGNDRKDDLGRTPSERHGSQTYDEVFARH